MSNEPDQVNSGALATIIALVAFVTLAVALVVTALVRDETSRLRAQGDQAQERPFRQLRAEQETQLNADAAWVDKAAGVARIPLESATQIVLEELRDNPLAFSPGNTPEDEEEEDAEGAETAAEETDEEGASETGTADEDSSDEEAPADPAKESAPTSAPKKLPPQKPMSKSGLPPQPAPSPAQSPAPVEGLAE